MPSRSAASFAGGAAVLRPRPRGLSGRVSKPATSCSAASRSSTSAPNSPVAATAIRRAATNRLADDDARAQARERLAPRLGRRAVEDQDAIEVVGLVLGDARVRLLELVPHLGAVLVLAPDRDLRRPLDREKHALDREAALVLDRRHLAAVDDLRVRERDGLALGDLEDEQPLQNSDLGRGEPDPVRVDHELLHPVGELAQVVVELLDRAGGHLQRRVRVLADLRERHSPSSLLLGVELLLLDLSLDLRHRAGLSPRRRGSQDAPGNDEPGRNEAGDAARAPRARAARGRSRVEPRAREAAPAAPAELPARPRFGRAGARWADRLDAQAARDRGRRRAARAPARGALENARRDARGSRRVRHSLARGRGRPTAYTSSGRSCRAARPATGSTTRATAGVSRAARSARSSRTRSTSSPVIASRRRPWSTISPRGGYSIRTGSSGSVLRGA